MIKRLTSIVLFLGLTGRLFAQTEEITVSAAASLTNAFTEIGVLFEKKTGIKPVFNFAASGALLQQVEKGAPVDVFASADQDTVDKGVEKNVFVASSRVSFVSNTLVLIVPSDSQARINKLRDLTTLNQIAIGAPSVPVGKYTRSALEKHDLWTSLEAKFIPGDSVRQVLDYVSRGEVDAGFVYATDAAIAKDKVKVVMTVKGHKPISYPLILVADSKKQEGGKKFIDFVARDKTAREVLERYGFGKP